MTTEQYPKVYLYRRIVQAKIYIDNNYTEKIDLVNISQEACFSKFHFIRLFKKIYGKTPHQYLKSVRLEKAKLLLRTDKSITEVCFLVGFESLSTFSNLFKNTIGASPTEFMSNQIARQKEIAVNPLKYIPSCIASKNGWIKNSNFEEALI